jgi:signal transduction histidine kinase
LGLSGAIVALARVAEKRWGGKVDVVHGVWPAALPAPIERTVFRVVQESLSNACRHSRSSSIRVTLGEHGGWLRVRVRDYGRGFDLENVPSECFGLRGIRERVKMMCGRVAIRSALGRGTRVTVELPTSVGFSGRYRPPSGRRQG